MSITKIVSFQRAITSFLFIPLMMMFVNAPVFGRTYTGDEIVVNVVDVRVQSDTIVIIYNLVGSSDETYEVAVTMLREKEPSFKVVPRTVSGDIGEGKFAGNSREIRWNYKKDFPRGLEGEGFYFELSVNKVGGGSPWLYIVLGAAAAGGGAAFLLGKKGEATQTVTNELPTPPARPQ